MRRRLSACLIFCLLFTGLGTPNFKAHSADLSDYLEPLTRSATVENTARYACLPEYDSGVDFVGSTRTFARLSENLRFAKTFLKQKLFNAKTPLKMN